MGELKLVKKAYKINFDKITEGYLACEQVCHADTKGKAKAELLRRIKYDGWSIYCSGEEVTYKNIPVIREPHYDRYLCEGKEMTILEITEARWIRERTAMLNNLLSDDSVKWCYIKKGPYYRPNACGYTDHRIFAGVYSKKDAVDHAISCTEITVIPINIDEHNKMIQDEINDLTSRLILA